MTEKNRAALDALFSELHPEELEPRLELQVLLDPLAAFYDSSIDNNCRDGGICKCVDDKGNVGPCPQGVGGPT